MWNLEVVPCQFSSCDQNLYDVIYTNLSESLNEETVSSGGWDCIVEILNLFLKIFISCSRLGQF